MFVWQVLETLPYTVYVCQQSSKGVYAHGVDTDWTPRT